MAHTAEVQAVFQCRARCQEVVWREARTPARAGRHDGARHGQASGGCRRARALHGAAVMPTPPKRHAEARHAPASQPPSALGERGRAGAERGGASSRGVDRQRHTHRRSIQRCGMQVQCIESSRERCPGNYDLQDGRGADGGARVGLPSPARRDKKKSLRTVAGTHGSRQPRSR